MVYAEYDQVWCSGIWRLESCISRRGLGLGLEAPSLALGLGLESAVLVSER